MSKVSPQERAKRVAAIVFVVAATSYCAYGVWNYMYAPSSSDVDEVMLTCLECDVDLVLSSGEVAELQSDGATGNMMCPQCGKPALVICTIRCGECGRPVPPMPIGSARACPRCGAPFPTREELEEELAAEYEKMQEGGG